MKNDKLLEITQKVLIEEMENPLIYKIIFPDGNELDKEYLDLREAQEDAEKLNAKNVKVRYKYNDSQSLFEIFIRREGFQYIKWMKYENNKFYIQNNFGWNEQPDYAYTMSVKLPPYLIGRYSDIYSEGDDYNTYLIVNIQNGFVYENEDRYDYTSITEIKIKLKEVLNGIYGETLYPPYYFNLLDY